MRKYQFYLLGGCALVLIILEIAFYQFKGSSPSTSSANPSVFIQPTSAALKEFDPNQLSTEGWQQLGFSPKQAETILKYKEKILGGSFTTKEQIAKCYVISEQKFNELEPYIRLSSPGPAPVTTFSGMGLKRLTIPGKFNPDQLSAKDWVRIGFSQKQAEVILKYKKMLGGSFQSKARFKECFVISDDAYRQLAPYLILPDGSSVNRTIALQPFYPDDLTSEGWQKLGFSLKQAEVILNYKKMLGGSFGSKQKVKECFVISDQKFRELEPYLLFAAQLDIPPAVTSTATMSRNYFNPNDLTKEGWMSWGFSEKQAETILKFKAKFPGGKFSSAAEVKKSYVISEKKFNELNPWMRFSEKSENKPQVSVQNLELNSITVEQLIAFGFPQNIASGFVSFRSSLGGFAHKEQVLEIYNIELNLAQKLQQSAQLDVSKVQKIDLITAHETTLKRHPYFKYFADKIVYFRISYPKKEKVLRKINPKPDQLRKMNWYLE